MEIKINIPDGHWAHGKKISVVAGKELLAYRMPFTRHDNGNHVTEYGPLMIKTDRCGKVEGVKVDCRPCCYGCVFLRYDGCSFGEQIPLSCVVSDCSKHFENCSERFIEWPGQ